MDAPNKGASFFDHLYLPDNRRWTRRHIETHVTRAISAHVKRSDKPDLVYLRYLTRLATESPFTECWYREAFDGPGARGKLLGEITPAYSAIGSEGVGYLLSLLEGVRIIYLVRDPVDRALSQVRMNMARSSTLFSDEKTWLRLAGAAVVRNRGKYSEYIPQWKKLVPRDRLIFIPFGRISAEPASVLKDVESFLDLSNHRYRKSNERVHASKPAIIPRSVINYLEDIMQDERNYLRTEFGEEFVGQI